MTKKIIGICLIVIGASIFLLFGYNYIKNLTTTKEEMIEQVHTELAKSGLDNTLSDEQLDKSLEESMKFGKIFSPIVILIGAGIAFGGFALYKRGKKDALLSNTIKFD